jgi:hypothetical protein
VLSAREGLDDEHRGAAVSAHEARPGAVVIGAAVAGVNGRRWRGQMQKSANGEIAISDPVTELLYFTGVALKR